MTTHSQARQRCAVTDAELQRFLDGETPDRRTIELAGHIAGCPRCRTRSVGARASASLLRALDDEPVVRWHRFRSPFGTMYAARTSRGLSRVSWQQPGVGAFEASLRERYPDVPIVRDRDALERVEEELEGYFAGDRERFTVPIDVSDLGEFRRAVLAEAARIPFGEVIAYAEMARRIGRPRAYRAVGNALGANPVAIVVPCHRIIASDGSLGGYTGGIAYKRRLLGIEGRTDLFTGVAT